MIEDIIQSFLAVLAILVLFSLILNFLPALLKLALIFGAFYLLICVSDWFEDRRQKAIRNYRPPPSPPPNPNPYTLEELQDHLNAYRQKALNSGNRDKWKYVWLFVGRRRL